MEESPPAPESRVRLNASPSKRMLLNNARAYSPDIAVFEIIDNAIDEWRDSPQDLAVEVHFDFENGRAASIRFRDNGGGVPLERLEALVKAGVANPNEKAIGVWGQGLKVACIVLGHTATFRTRYGEGPQYRIDWPKDWWLQEQWELWAVTEQPTLPPGTFELTLTDLKAPLRSEEVFGLDPDEEADEVEEQGEALLSRLGRIYAPLLSESVSPRVNITLFRNEEPYKVAGTAFGDPARLTEVFAFPPGFEPTSHLRSFGPLRQLHARAIVGLLPEQSRDYSGVTMYGKGRLFVQALKEGTVGFGTRGAAMIPASHPTTWRLLVLIYFDGPSEEIPWRAPSKENYQENNPHSKEIKAFIAEIAAPYASFTRVAKRLDILPYSLKWQSMEPDDVHKEVKSYCKSEDDVEKVLKANPHLTDAKPFDPAIIEVNHMRQAPLPPVPSLNPAASRAIALSLSKREPAAARLWSPESYQETVSALSSTGKPGRPARTASAELVKTALMAEAWKDLRAVTVRLPAVMLTRVENAARGSVNAWVLHAIEQRLGREVDPLFSIPDEAGIFRPVLQVITEKIVSAAPDVQAIALFGSVARGAADRASDIDLLVVHEQRTATQRALNEMFKHFRFPAVHGDRFEVRAQVTNATGLQTLSDDKDEKVQAMLSEAIWLYGPDKVTA